MPLRKQVKSLKQLSIEVINYTPLYPKYWLRSLPPSLLEELILYPTDANQSLQLYPADIWGIIRKEITRLEIEFEKIWKPECFLNSALRTCSGITHLTLKNPNILTPDDYIHFVRYIPNIIDLKIEIEKDVINDDILEAIGDNCPKLENLRLGSCAISDDGIRRFCQSKSRGSNMKYLNFKHSDVTAKGILIALRNLKQLRKGCVDEGMERDCDKMIEAFKIMFDEWDKSRELPTFQLCELPEIYLDQVPSGFLQFLTKCCPNVSNLVVFSIDNFSKDIIEIRKCDQIMPLSLIVSGESIILDWSDVGSKLTCLVITFSNIDLKRIGLNCPNLKGFDLSCSSCLAITNVRRESEQVPFRKLLKLNLRSIPNSHLKFLFQNCLSLEKLCIKRNTNIYDDDMIHILHEVNPLRHLTHFSIYWCHNLTKRVIMELLIMENNLQYLNFEQGDPDDYNDKMEIESYIKENNFEVKQEI